MRPPPNTLRLLRLLLSLPGHLNKVLFCLMADGDKRRTPTIKHAVIKFLMHSYNRASLDFMFPSITPLPSLQPSLGYRCQKRTPLASTHDWWFLLLLVLGLNNTLSLAPWPYRWPKMRSFMPIDPNRRTCLYNVCVCVVEKQGGRWCGLLIR